MMTSRFPVSSIAGDMISLRSAMDRLFNDSFVPGQQAGDIRSQMPLDVYATDDAVVVLTAIPGMNADDIEIIIEKNVVKLAGEMPNVADAEDTKNATWYLHELPYGRFERTVSLPMELDANRAEATFENGMLRLTLPKAESAKARQIKVQVVGSTPIADHAEAVTAD